MQYEPSIYSSWLWIIPVVFLLAGIALLVFKRELWLVGFGLIVISSAVVLVMPLIHGYWCANRHDMMDHIGYAIDLSNFSLSKANPYPIIHLLPASLLWLGIKPNLAIGLLPVLCLAIYVFSVWFLAKTLYGNGHEAKLAAVMAAVLVLPVQGEFTSSVMIGAVFPLILVLYFRAVGCYGCNWCGLFVLAALLAPFFHAQVTALLIAVILMGFAVGYRRQSVWPLVAMVGLFCLWYWGRAIMTLPTAVYMTIGPGNAEAAATAAGGVIQAPPVSDLYRPSPLSLATEAWAKVGMGIPAILLFMMAMNGGEIIYGMVTLVCIGFAIPGLKKSWKQDRRVILIYAGLFSMLLLFWLYFFGALEKIQAVLGEFSSRLIFIMPALMIIVMVPVLVRFMNKGIYARVAVALLLFLAGTLGIFNAYPSPTIYQPNRMVTQNEINGVNWLLDNMESETPVAHLGLSLRRYAVAINGINWWNNRKIALVGEGNPYPEKRVDVPDHLGYDQHQSIGEVFSKPTYLMITSYDRLLYKECWKEPIPARWTDEDFNRLETDLAAELQYRNPDFEVWLINKGGE